MLHQYQFLPETWHFTTIVRTMMKTAHRTQCILQIWINLHFFREFCRFDFNECRCHCLHVWTIAIKCYTTRTNRIFMLVGINAYFHTPSHNTHIYFKYICIQTVSKKLTYPHKQHHRISRSWFLPIHRPSIFHAKHQQKPFFSRPISVTLESHNSNQQWSREWLPPFIKLKHWKIQFSVVVRAMGGGGEKGGNNNCCLPLWPWYVLMRFWNSNCLSLHHCHPESYKRSIIREPVFPIRRLYKRSLLAVRLDSLYLAIQPYKINEKKHKHILTYRLKLIFAKLFHWKQKQKQKSNGKNWKIWTK